MSKKRQKTNAMQSSTALARQKSGSPSSDNSGAESPEKLTETGEGPERWHQAFATTDADLRVYASRTQQPTKTHLGANMTTNELKQSVRSKLEAAICAQRESWDAALGIEEVTGYAGDIYAFVAETAGGLKDDEAIPDDLVEELISSTTTPSVSPGSSSPTP